MDMNRALLLMMVAEKAAALFPNNHGIRDACNKELLEMDAEFAKGVRQARGLPEPVSAPQADGAATGVPHRPKFIEPTRGEGHRQEPDAKPSQPVSEPAPPFQPENPPAGESPATPRRI